MALGELTHVQGNKRVFIAEQELRERLAQLRLTDSRGPGEDEGARRPTWVFQTGPGPANRLRQRLDGVFLSDDAAVEFVLHPSQFLDVVLGQIRHRNARHQRENFTDELLVDLGDDVEVARLPFTLALCLLREQVLLHIPQRRSLLEILRVDRRFLLFTSVGNTVIKFTKVRRRCHSSNAQARASFVNQVDGLVRKLAIGNVAIRQASCRFQSAIGDGNAVMRLVPVS